MTDVSNQRVGFVGLGDQGGPMALAIGEAGFLLHAWARRSQSYDALGGAAFERHDDLASLGRAVDVLGVRSSRMTAYSEVIALRRETRDAHL
jgi:3-hydroxyisobutyrate dehydrogenase-like beta-hydroxyacid dehydrogenase